MSDQVVPFLMFDGQAEEAMRFYVSLFPASEVIEIARYGKGAEGAEGTVSRARFSIGGQTIMCTDSTVKHAFSFTPAISLFVQCTSKERMRVLVERLSAGGHVYFTSLADGEVTVIKAGGDKPTVVAKNPKLGERVAATPAIAGNVLYLRTEGSLYAFAESP